MLGGGRARVQVDATAFAHRAAKIRVNVAAFYEGPDEMAARSAWVDGFVAALDQGDGSAYVNFLSDEGEARVHAAYPGATLDRLAAIQAQYDPANLFRLHQNLPPTIG